MAMEATTEENDTSFVDDVTEETVDTTDASGKGGTAAATTTQPDELKSAMAELAKTMGGLAAKETAPQEKVLSDDEKAELWGVWNPTKSDPDFFRKWLRLNTDMDPAEVEKAIKDYQPLFAQMQQGLVKQSLVGARNLLQIEMAKLREELNPALDYVSTAKTEAMRGRFFSAYSALDDDKFSKVIDASARLLASQNFPDEKSYFKALAESAAETIKGVLPTFDLGAVTTKKTAVTSPRLPRSRVGGTGGTAAAGGTQQKDKTSDDDSDTLDWMK